MERPVVIIRSCKDYDVSRIRNIAREALERLNLRPFGKTLVKPNAVASGEQFPHAYTRPEFLEGVFLALKDRAGGNLQEIALGERSGITMPTRFVFGRANYYKMLSRLKDVNVYHFEETPQVEIPLYHKERLRDYLFTPQPVAQADFFVNCPKFKAHPWTTVTFSMKNYIGIQDDRHRLIDHDYKLDEKVADLQYIIQPQFIAIDGIIAGEGRMLTPIPFDLKLVIMGNNQVAFDAVCCQIIGIDPLTVPHIRLAHERGFGPVSMDEIQIEGDITLEEAKKRAFGFKTGLVRVEDYFKDSRIRAYAGPYPGGEKQDYCWGGCPGALEEAVEVLRQIEPTLDEKIRRMHIVFGKYEGDLNPNKGEKVVFMGDCSNYNGLINGKNVKVENIYMDRMYKNPHNAHMDDIYVKMLKVQNIFMKNRKSDYIRLAGCPVSVAEQTLVLSVLGKVKNPFFEADAIGFTHSYLSWRTRTLLQRLLGKPYQIIGPTVRGQSRPYQNLPAEGSHHPLEISV